MLLDSRIFEIEPFPYTNSSDTDNHSWGQPPASHFQIRVVDGIMMGEPIRASYPSELSRWEELGINDWINFEGILEDLCLT